jgi:hypothetical protein
MTDRARTAARIVGFTLVAIALLYIALHFAFRSETFRSWTEAELSERSGLNVRLGTLNLHFPFRVVADNVEIAKPRGFSFTTERLSLTLNPLDLPLMTLHRLRTERPILQVDIQQLGGSGSDAAPIALRHLNVHDGTIVLIRGEEKLFELPKIDLQAENINLGGQAGVTLRADVPALNGTAELIVKGHSRELESAVVIRAKKTQGLFGGDVHKGSSSELVRLDAKIRASEKQAAEATINGKFHDLGINQSKLTGTLAARINLDADFHNADFTGHATLADFPGALTAALSKLPRGTLQASFAGIFSLPQKKLTLKSMRLASQLGSGSGDGEVLFDPQPSIARARFGWQDMPLENLKLLLPTPLSRWTYEGQARIDGEISGPWNALAVRGIARSENGQFRGAEVKAASLKVDLPFEWVPTVLRIAGAKLDAGKIDYNRENRWQAAVERLQANASFALQTDQPLRIDGRFQTIGGKFNSPESDKVGENLSLNGSFVWTSRPVTSSYGFDIQFGVDAGEILWGKFFSDLKARKPTFALDADYFGSDDRLECRRCAVSVVDVGTIAASGAVTKLTQTPELRLQARSAAFLPGGFFEHFLRDNLKRRFPVLDEIAIGGELSFETLLRGRPGDLSAAGELSLKAGDLRSRSKQWQVGPVALKLPFEVRWAETKRDSLEPAPTGTLTIERARFGKQSLGPIRASISLSNNALRFHQSIRAALFGGEILVGALFWPDVITDPKRLSFSLEAKRLDLEALTAALKWPTFSGTLTGSIPEVQSSSDRLKTNGQIQAELFGGNMAMNEFEIENPFSPLAAIRLDADFQNIRLEQLSKTFAFGHISGMVAGTIDDLVIVDGQPAQFSVELHSVDRGGEQRISVEALDKITVLSSGQNAGALYGGLAGFFDSFRYSKLGFKAHLKNDRLTLRGVETRGEQEYLVVGSFLPPTVNIVSHTQAIGFSELMRRLERIKSSKPQVK